MNIKSFAWSVVLALLLMTVTVASAPEWESLHHVEKSGDGFVTTGADPWMISAPFDPAVPGVNSCLLVEMVSSKAIRMEVRWWDSPRPTYDMDRTLALRIPASSEPVSRAIDLGREGKFDGARAIRIDPGGGSGLKFQISKLQLVPVDQVPLALVPELMEFRCYTSRLHYRPGETIEYQAAFVTRAYPDRKSSKILEVKVLDADGRTVAKSVGQYGIHALQQWKEISGRIDPPQPLGPGKYRLLATSTDQWSGFKMTATHDFGIQGPDDPLLYETPFKFVKDFSVIKGPDHRWHVFSITGDFFGNHDWLPDGQERTFSHASSTNLRDWTIHRPVISISNKTYPDGRGRFKDRNVWAPHVIEHKGQYWMFYTSVNEQVSQSISLATSRDLFEWVEWENNPVFTLEDVAWAKWDRGHWANCRDPVVLDDGGEFYLYVTASVEPPGETGAVVVARSDDL
ncbi:MAG: glycoside hydrolase family protein, partial [Planctomycetota bacterium]